MHECRVSKDKYIDVCRLEKSCCCKYCQSQECDDKCDNSKDKETKCLWEE